MFCTTWLQPGSARPAEHLTPGQWGSQWPWRAITGREAARKWTTNAITICSNNNFPPWKVKEWSMLPREREFSILRNCPHLTEQSFKDLALKLFLFRAGGWIRWPPEFSSSLSFLWIFSCEAQRERTRSLCPVLSWVLTEACPEDA